MVVVCCNCWWNWKKGETYNGHLVDCVILDYKISHPFPCVHFMFLTMAFLAACFIFLFCSKKHGNHLNCSWRTFFFLVLTAASKFLTQDCSRLPNGNKEMSLFSCRVIWPYESRIFYKFVDIVLRSFSFFYEGFNSWCLYDVTVGGIEKKVRLTMGICSIVLLGWTSISV